MATPMWLDCDTGHDDAFAILLAARHPNVHLLGISTTYGNAPLENTTYNTRAILKAIGREDIPVYAGASKPFCRDVIHSPDIHGDTGLDGTTVLPVPEVAVRNDHTAANAMYQALINTPKGSAWLVLIGALTNGALLFATHPDLAAHLGGVSIMGGAIGGDFTHATVGKTATNAERIGNVTPWAEFNVYIDPESAKSILSNPILTDKTTLITLDLTHTFLATQSVREGLLNGYNSLKPIKSSPSLVRQLFVEILNYFGTTYAAVFGISAGPPVHDPLAVAAAFAPGLFFDTANSAESLRYAVEVVTDGVHNPSSRSERAVSQCGRTLVTPVHPDSGLAGMRIPRAVDAEKVWHMIEQCLGASENVTG